MWFYQECITAVPCLQCSQHNVKNKQKQILISNQHIWVPRWCAFNFVQILSWCMFGMPSNSGSKLNNNTCRQKLWFLKKNLLTAWNWTHDLLNASTHLATSSVVYSGMLLEFSPLLHLQSTAEWKLIISLTCGDILKVEGQWVCAVRQLCWCW